jgi:protein gp37
MVKRFPHLHGIDMLPSHMGYGPGDADPYPFSRISFHPGRLDQPLRWKKPRRIFVCSMGDLFHEDVSEEWIDKVIGTMYLAPQHTFMVLTKRPERMLRYMKPDNYDTRTWPIKNLWLGVTAENQEMADLRIPILLQTPAAKRFVSVEPMLGPVYLRPFLPHEFNREPHCPWCEDCIPNRGDWDGWKETREGKHGPFLDWVICGGESGPGARPMHPDWPRSLRDQCQAAGVPFFFKQWGEWMAASDSSCPCGPPRKDWMWADGKPFWTGDGDRGIPLFRRVGKKAAGCLLDGREHKESPDVT